MEGRQKRIRKRERYKIAIKIRRPKDQLKRFTGRQRKGGKRGRKRKRERE